MKQDNLVPLVLLIFGAVVALFYAALSIADGSAEYAIEFAFAALIAVIGWSELRASIEANE